MSKQTELAQLGDAVTVSSNGEVGIGTGSDSLTRELTVKKNDQCDVAIVAATNQSAQLLFGDTDADNRGIIEYNNSSDYMGFTAAGSERARIDSSGNFMVATTSNQFSLTSGGDAGMMYRANASLDVARDDGTVMFINRLTSSGDLVEFRKDGSGVGSIGTDGSSLYIGSFTGSDSFINFESQAITPSNSSGGSRDNAIDLGKSDARFDDIYATNGTIQTSDRNEKQDIAELTEAEQRVAVAAKGLLRKFRWKSAVVEKGDNARTHFGIIAQDLQAAFAAEGLDASDYAMFISSTWWETQTEVPAVEADEENGIEAKDAYTRIDTYNTAEEAPEGATQRTRLGVRYSELLAFIIGAL